MRQKGIHFCAFETFFEACFKIFVEAFEKLTHNIIKDFE